MKNLTTSFGRRLGLVAVILAAGFCYSCGLQGAPVPLMGDRGTVLAEAAVTERDPAGGDAAPGDGAGAVAAPGDEAGAAAVPERDAGAAAPAAMTSAAAPAVFRVHVCGEVKAPGVYELEEDQRICDAIEQAGGFTEEAATDYLNLAEPVRDGMKLAVPNRDDIPKREWAPEQPGYGQAGISGYGQAGTSGYGQAGISEYGQTGTAGDSQGAAVSDSRLVNLNTATKEELMSLTGIGEAKAADILRYREEHGRFERIEDVMKISGIKEAAFQKIRDNITVSP